MFFELGESDMEFVKGDDQVEYDGDKKRNGGASAVDDDGRPDLEW